MLALAIQGIGGMNAFAAGVLQEFRNRGVYPDIISATSGSILSAYYYLDSDPKAILRYYEQVSTKDVNSWPDEVQFFQNVLWGISGVFRPISPMERFIENFPFIQPKSWLNTLFPAKVYQPMFPDAFYENIANRFLTSSTGIITNAYHYDKDKPVLYLNPTAFAITGLEVGENENYLVKEITVDGIRNCLQLLQYGDRNGEYDGAYQLNPVIHPLTVVDKIVLITVESIERSLKKIENYFDTQDFLLKMLFKNAIHAELNGIRLVNKLIQEGKLSKEYYHEIDVQVVQPSTYRGYFNYFIEDLPFFQDGIDQGKKFFENNFINK